jgi:hypothetical protein
MIRSDGGNRGGRRTLTMNRCPSDVTSYGVPAPGCGVILKSGRVAPARNDAPEPTMATDVTTWSGVR